MQLLKMASNLHTSITAYQVTDKGMHIVDRLSKVSPTQPSPSPPKKVAVPAFCRAILALYATV